MLTFKEFISEGNKRTNRRAWKAVPGDEKGEVAPFYTGKKIFYNRRQRRAEYFSKSNSAPGSALADVAKSKYYGKDSKLRAAVRGVHPYAGSRAKPPTSK